MSSRSFRLCFGQEWPTTVRRDGGGGKMTRGKVKGPRLKMLVCGLAMAQCIMACAPDTDDVGHDHSAVRQYAPVERLDLLDAAMPVSSGTFEGSYTKYVTGFFGEQTESIDRATIVAERLIVWADPATDTQWLADDLATVTEVTLLGGYPAVGLYLVGVNGSENDVRHALQALDTVQMATFDVAIANTSDPVAFATGGIKELEREMRRVVDFDDGEPRPYVIEQPRDVDTPRFAFLDVDDSANFVEGRFAFLDVGYVAAKQLLDRIEPAQHPVTVAVIDMDPVYEGISDPNNLDFRNRRVHTEATTPHAYDAEGQPNHAYVVATLLAAEADEEGYGHLGATLAKDVTLHIRSLRSTEHSSGTTSLYQLLEDVIVVTSAGASVINVSMAPERCLSSTRVQDTDMLERSTIYTFSLALLLHRSQLYQHHPIIVGSAGRSEYCVSGYSRLPFRVSPGEYGGRTVSRLNSIYTGEQRSSFFNTKRDQLKFVTTARSTWLTPLARFDDRSNTYISVPDTTPLLGVNYTAPNCVLWGGDDTFDDVAPHPTVRLCGQSFATPFVAGLLATTFSIEPELVPEERVQHIWEAYDMVNLYTSLSYTLQEREYDWDFLEDISAFRQSRNGAILYPGEVRWDRAPWVEGYLVDHPACHGGIWFQYANTITSSPVQDQCLQWYSTGVRIANIYPYSRKFGFSNSLGLGINSSYNNAQPERLQFWWTQFETTDDNIAATFELKGTRAGQLLHGIWQHLPHSPDVRLSIVETFPDGQTEVVRPSRFSYLEGTGIVILHPFRRHATGICSHQQTKLLAYLRHLVSERRVHHRIALYSAAGTDGALTTQQQSAEELHHEINELGCVDANASKPLEALSSVLHQIKNAMPTQAHEVIMLLTGQESETLTTGEDLVAIATSKEIEISVLISDRNEHLRYTDLTDATGGTYSGLSDDFVYDLHQSIFRQQGAYSVEWSNPVSATNIRDITFHISYPTTLEGEVTAVTSHRLTLE